MKTTNDKILVERTSDKTAGGIYIPELNMTAGYAEGRVVEIGPGRYNPNTGEYVQPGFKVGDRILFNTGVAAPIKIKKDASVKTYYLMAAVEAAVILDEGESI